MNPPYEVAVVGLGYVGLTLAAALHRVGTRVVGIEPRHEIREALEERRSPYIENGLSRILGDRELPALAGLSATYPLASTYVICVGTPLGDDYMALRSATGAIASNMGEGALVIVRSTVAIGTTAKLIDQMLKAAGKPYDLAVCPERTVEGDALAEISSLPQIIGGPLNATIRAENLFQRLMSHVSGPGSRRGGMVSGLTWEEAEATKLLANAWRDVTFGFANEVAALSTELGMRASKVIMAANYNYPRADIPSPGPAGGPCLSKDSLLLAAGRPETLWGLARDRNASVPWAAAEHIRAIAAQRNMPMLRVAVLGTAFKGVPETDDVRGSPSTQLVLALREAGAGVSTVDPLAAADSAQISGRFDVIVIATNHPRWKAVPYSKHLAEGGFVYDLWGICSALAVGGAYYRFGG